MAFLLSQAIAWVGAFYGPMRVPHVAVDIIGSILFAKVIQLYWLSLKLLQTYFSGNILS